MIPVQPTLPFDALTDGMGELHMPKRTVIGPSGHPVVVRERRLSRAVRNHAALGAPGLDRAKNADRGPQPSVETVETFGEDQVREWEASSDSQDRARARAIRLGIDTRDHVIEYAERYPDRLLLNTGRPPLPPLPGGREYTLDDLRAHESKRVLFEGPEVFERIAAEERVCQLDYERICAGGVPDRTVIVHNDLTDMGTEAYPVPVMGTSLRQLRLMWMDYTESNFRMCWWCRQWQDDADIDAIMPVTCGATTRAFPTCPACEREFRDDLGDGVDFLHVSDRTFFEIGLPSDEYLPTVEIRRDRGRR